MSRGVSDGLVAPFFLGPARHAYRLLTRRDYREHCLLAARLGSAPRFSERHAKLGGWQLSIPDAASFLSTHEEIFVQGIYDFPSLAPEPVILDLGANIGLGVLYWKRRYPRAKITAVEADPQIFRHLTTNVHGNGYRDVVLLNRVVWDRDTTVRFLPEGGDGGRVAERGEEGSVAVPTITLPQLLERGAPDLLKIDVEGAEDRILTNAAATLKDVGHIFVEYHSVAGEPQTLAKIVATLTEAGFRLHVQSLSEQRAPLLTHRAQNGFDLQLNIFGWRE